MKAKRQTKQGFSLVATLFIMAAVSTFMAMLVHSGRQQAFTAQRLTNRIKATAYAEAAFEHAMAHLISDWDFRYNAAACLPSDAGVQSVKSAPSAAKPASAGAAIQSAASVSSTDGATSAQASFGEGTFTLNLTPISNKYCFIETVGECGGQSVEVEVLVEDLNAGSAVTDIRGTAWENTLFAAGTMTLGGNGDISGSLHSNGQLKMNGNVAINPSAVEVYSSTKIRLNGNIDVDGTFTAPVITVTGNNLGNNTFSEQAVAQKAFPEYDLTELYNTALANGQVIDGNVRSGSDLNWDNVPGGVKWINGYLKVAANANLNCIVVATDYINITGNANWGTGYTDNHIISRDSTIKIAGNTEVRGLIYAPGDITLSGNARIYGQVISGEDIAVNGNVEVVNYTYSGPSGTGNPLDPDVSIAVWQK